MYTKEDEAFDNFWEENGLSSVPFEVQREDCKIGWKGALEWRDGQSHASVAFVDSNRDIIPKVQLSPWTNLYTNPTANINEDILKALEGFCSLMQYQYTGSKEAMSALQEADDQAQDVLKLLKEHYK